VDDIQWALLLWFKFFFVFSNFLFAYSILHKCAHIVSNNLSMLFIVAVQLLYVCVCVWFLFCISLLTYTFRFDGWKERNRLSMFNKGNRTLKWLISSNSIYMYIKSKQMHWKCIPSRARRVRSHFIFMLRGVRIVSGA
jgi:hypothetical protein